MSEENVTSGPGVPSASPPPSRRPPWRAIALALLTLAVVLAARTALRGISAGHPLRSAADLAPAGGELLAWAQASESADLMRAVAGALARRPATRGILDRAFGERIVDALSDPRAPQALAGPVGLALWRADRGAPVEPVAALRLSLAGRAAFRWRALRGRLEPTEVTVHGARRQAWRTAGSHLALVEEWLLVSPSAGALQAALAGALDRDAPPRARDIAAALQDGPGPALYLDTPAPGLAAAWLAAVVPVQANTLRLRVGARFVKAPRAPSARAPDAIASALPGESIAYLAVNDLAYLAQNLAAGAGKEGWLQGARQALAEALGSPPPEAKNRLSIAFTRLLPLGNRLVPSGAIGIEAVARPAAFAADVTHAVHRMVNEDYGRSTIEGLGVRQATLYQRAGFPLGPGVLPVQSGAVLALDEESLRAAARASSGTAPSAAGLDRLPGAPAAVEAHLHVPRALEALAQWMESAARSMSPGRRALLEKAVLPALRELPEASTLLLRLEPSPNGLAGEAALRLVPTRS